MSSASLDEVVAALGAIAPVSYGSWDRNMSLPCMTIMEGPSSGFCTDNRILVRRRTATASLYTRGKDAAMQGAVRDALCSLGCIPSTDEMPVAEQAMFRTDFEFNLIGD